MGVGEYSKELPGIFTSYEHGITEVAVRQAGAVNRSVRAISGLNRRRGCRRRHSSSTERSSWRRDWAKGGTQVQRQRRGAELGFGSGAGREARKVLVLDGMITAPAIAIPQRRG